RDGDSPLQLSANRIGKPTFQFPGRIGISGFAGSDGRSSRAFKVQPCNELFTTSRENVRRNLKDGDLGPRYQYGEWIEVQTVRMDAQQPCFSERGAATGKRVKDNLTDIDSGQVYQASCELWIE